MIGKEGWSFAKVAGSIGIALATAFFAMVINFVAEIRSELATLRATVSERTVSADEEINKLRTRVADYDQGVDGKLAQLQTTIEVIQTKVDERTTYSDAEINNLREWVGKVYETANESLLTVQKLEKRIDTVVDHYFKDLKQEIQKERRSPP